MPTPKKPADRKPKNVEKPQIDDVTQVPGWELLRPFEEIPVWEQTPLIATLEEAMDNGVAEVSKEQYAKMTEEEREAYNKDVEEKGLRKSFDIEIIGKLAFKLMDYAIDKDDYLKFASGKGAMQRTMNLAMAWVGQMGEFGSSEDS